MLSIEWTISSNTHFVIVNWYKLKKFNPWDNKYKYNAMIKWWNIKPWLNIIKVETFNDKYFKIDEKQVAINIKLIEDIIDEIKEEWEVKDWWEEIKDVIPDTKAILQIISPKEWEIMSWNIIEIKWIAPEWAVSIYFWDYKLTKFKEWDKEFIYRASTQWGNLNKWERNTFLIKAKDWDWNVIESINFSFFSEE